MWRWWPGKRVPQPVYFQPTEAAKLPPPNSRQKRLKRFRVIGGCFAIFDRAEQEAVCIDDLPLMFSGGIDAERFIPKLRNNDPEYPDRFRVVEVDLVIKRREVEG